MSDRLEQIGEVKAIARLIEGLPTTPSVTVGAGDDCAVVRMETGASDLLLTSDPVTQGTHFTAADDPAAVGHKAAGRVLSDLAAMGGTPAWMLVNITAPPETNMATIEQIMSGACSLAERFDAAVVGGDLSRGPVLSIHVFGVGTVPQGTAILRSGAQSSDTLFVTGTLGGSRRVKHLTFNPRVREGQWLRGWATAMIDISDGLASDLHHLAIAGGVGAEVNLAQIPVAADLKPPAANHAPWDPALYDGEDFELLFTIPAKRQTAFQEAWSAAHDVPCTAIGTLTATPGIIRLHAPDGSCTDLDGTGYEHFRKS